MGRGLALSPCPVTWEFGGLVMAKALAQHPCTQVLRSPPFSPPKPLPPLPGAGWGVLMPGLSLLALLTQQLLIPVMLLHQTLFVGTTSCSLGGGLRFGIWFLTPQLLFLLFTDFSGASEHHLHQH